MIYRIHHDDAFLIYEVSAIESMSQLGEQHGTFAFDSTPRSYSSVWKTLTVQFKACEPSCKNIIPDVSENFGRLFLSQKAHDCLSELLSTCGECLPVKFADDSGYIFNPLKTSEQLDANNEKTIVHDQHGNLVNYGFHEEKVSGSPIFKTQLDRYSGIFCLESFKDAYEQAGLTGLMFHPDLSNPIGESFGSTQ